MSWDILPKSNLQYFLQKLKGKFDGKVDIVAGKGLSTNDYTTTEKNKLAGIESGAQINPTIDSALSSTSTNSVQNKVVKSALDEKADNSDVTETDTTNNTPFLYRETPYEADRVFLDELVGGSVVVNQLVPIAESSKTKTSGNLTITDNRDGSYTITGTTSTTVFVFLVATMPLTLTHKYLLLGMANKNGVTVQDTYSGNFVSGKDTIYNRTISNRFEFCIVIQSTFDGVSTVIKPQFIDLTQMFGTAIADYSYSLEQATAGSGIAWLKSHGFFTKDYYPYNTGELISVKTSGKKYVGKNKIDVSPVTMQSDGYYLSNYTLPQALPVGTYTISIKSSSNAAWSFWVHDENGNEVGAASSASSISGVQSATFTTNGIGVVVGGYVNAATTLSEFMLESGSTPIPYEPYTETIYDISNIDLRGIPKLVNNELVYDGDTYESDGDVTRKYGIVDLGNANYEYVSVLAQDGIFPIVISDRKSNVNVISAFNIDVAANWDDIPNKSIRVVNYEQNMRVRFDGCTTVDQIKAAMSGVYLVYELATPTTEQLAPFTNPQICDKDGTEEFIDNRTVPVPVGHNSRYANLPSMMDGDFLNYMAKNFASEEYVDRALEEVDTELDTKVDKVEGKGLSTNDYTNEEKALVETIPDKADADDVKSTQTATGNPITLTDGSETYAQGLSVELEPKQDLHGYDFPWVGGAGKNKLDVTTSSSSQFTRSGEVFTNTVTDTRDFLNLQIKDGNTTLFGNAIRQTGVIVSDVFTISNNTSSISIRHSGAQADLMIFFSQTIKADSYKLVIDITGYNPSVIGGLSFKNIMLIPSTETNTDFAPYANICPISGYEGVEVTIADSATDPTQSRTASVTFGQTVYGGIINLLTGECVVDHVKDVLKNLAKSDFSNGVYSTCYRAHLSSTSTAVIISQTHGAISDMGTEQVAYWGAPRVNEDYSANSPFFDITTTGDVLAVYDNSTTITESDFLAKYEDVEVCYPLAEPITIQLTPQELKLLQDTNNITTNGTTITLDYIPNNSIGDAVKASEEYTDRAVEGKADNTTAYVDLPGNYDTTNKNFPTRSATSGSVENCLTYINDLADKLYTAINSHATALTNIPTKTVVVDHRAIDVGDEFNISLPLSYKFLIFELYIYANGECGSIVSTDFANGSVLSIVANGHGSSYWCDLSRMANRITVDGNFDSTHGELTITAF